MTTANRQERRVKKERKADEQAEAIISETVERVKEEGRKRGEATAEEIEKGLEVKRLRDEGMAWWQIAFTLGLPGSADNVKQGKSGASRARRLYVVATGGPLPATPRSLAKKQPDPFGNGAKPQGVQKRGVIKKSPQMASMFDEPLTGQEIGEMLRGKKITYINSVGGNEEEHRVHHKYDIKITRVGTVGWHPPMKVEYAITFRDADARDDRGLEMGFRDFPGGTRTVRLSSIIRVSQ